MKKIITNYQLLITLVVIIAAFLRLYNIAEVPPGLYPDEAMNGNNALEALTTVPPASGFKIFYPENNGREGLFINIQAVFLRFLMPLFGGQPEPWMLRLPSAIFGILTVLGVYFLAKELFRKNFQFSILNFESNSNVENLKTFGNWKLEIGNYEVALLSSFLLATSFWHINFSRIGFRAIMAPFFLTWGVYLFLRVLRYAKSELIASDRPSLLAMAAGVIYGLGFHSYIAYRATPLLFLAFLPRFRKDRTFWQILTAFGIGAVAAALPLVLYFLNQPEAFLGRTAQVSVFGSPTPLKDLGINILKTAAMFNFAGDWNWRHNYAGRPELFWPAGILFLIGIFLAIKNLIQKLKIKNQNGNLKFQNAFTNPSQANTDILHFAFCILISWLIIAALPVVVSNEGIPHGLRSILMIPPVFILAGAGGVWLFSRIKNYEFRIMNSKNRELKVIKTIIRTSLFIILSFMLFESYHTYFIKWAKNPNVPGAFSADYVQIGRHLRSLPRELPKYVIVEASGIDVRGIPMPVQTVMFLTDTFTPQKQKEKNIFYVLPKQKDRIPADAFATVLK
ncbi:glycosyltransferase family 39 protein [Candidatus Wolfebacteria bacterium]|nr:glycosyltransferase family 39 protein [Candidatus Wolfebacteria bacterium]